jgi:thaumarchaeosortase
MAVYSDTFSLAWNEGRGGFIFAMAFIAAELVGLKLKVSQKRFIIVLILAAITITYFAALPFGLRDSIQKTGESIEVSLLLSWVWMWDFIVMAMFVGASAVVLFGKKWYKIAPAGAIYLAGTAVILSLDAFFPYDSLGPLQFIVPIYLQIDQAVVTFIDNNIMDIGKGVAARGNLLVLNGLKGPFALQVFWPSAGVHSMIIYTLVMLAFLLKMEIPLRRKLIYFAIGTFGTAAVNVIRIISLTLYAMVVTTDVKEWEAFHSVAGEIMFLPWLGVFLGIVMYIESKRIRKLRQQQSATPV